MDKNNKILIICGGLFYENQELAFTLAKNWGGDIERIAQEKYCHCENGISTPGVIESLNYEQSTINRYWQYLSKHDERCIEKTKNHITKYVKEMNINRKCNTIIIDHYFDQINDDTFLLYLLKQNKLNIIILAHADSISISPSLSSELNYNNFNIIHKSSIDLGE